MHLSRRGRGDSLRSLDSDADGKIGTGKCTQLLVLGARVKMLVKVSPRSLAFSSYSIKLGCQASPRMTPTLFTLKEAIQWRPCLYRGQLSWQRVLTSPRLHPHLH